MEDGHQGDLLEFDSEDESSGAQDHDSAPVGYKNPPAKTQFKRGRSGNPKGRPKGTENLSKLLREILAERVSVTQGGRKTRMSKAEALVELLMSQAINGNATAIDRIMDIASKIQKFGQPGEEGEIKPGIVLLPEKCATDEEWERLYGAAARGEHLTYHDSWPPPP